MCTSGSRERGRSREDLQKPWTSRSHKVDLTRNVSPRVPLRCWLRHCQPSGGSFMRGAWLDWQCGRESRSRRLPPRLVSCSVVAVPSVVLTTLYTAVSRLALITKTAAQGTIEPRASLPTGILEAVDLGPFISWNTSVLLGRNFVLGVTRKVFPSGLQQLLLALSASSVLLGLR